VFEIHEATGAERAIAGGGRYDNLIESFGGPKLPACGFGMGDVVLANILRDKGLLNPSEEYLPRPDAFVIAADDDAAARVSKVVASLRTYGLHVRQSYKTTRNVGKLLGDASKCRARFAVILGEKLAENIAELKDMDGGEQRELRLDELAAALRQNS
jgi:histidyl-tRNA synthetase